LGFYLYNGTLVAQDLDGLAKWSFTGDGNLVSTPLAAGGVVYIGSSSGNLYAVDEMTGTQVWNDNLGNPVAPANESRGGWPITGLGASYDLLIVPSGLTLTA